MGIQKGYIEKKVSNILPNIRNGGFEIGTGTRAAAGWIGNEEYGWYVTADGDHTGDTFGFDAIEAHSGNQSMGMIKNDNTTFSYIQSIGRNVGGFGIDHIDHSVRILPSTNYTVSCWIKTDLTSLGTNGNVFAYYSTANSSYTLVTDRTAINTNITATQDWTQYTKTFTSGASDAYLFITLLIVNFQGSAWFDDINIELTTATTYNKSKIPMEVIDL